MSPPQSRPHLRLLAQIAPLVLLAVSVVPSLVHGREPANEEEVTAFFRNHCVRCHCEKKSEGDLQMDNLSRDFESGSDVERWSEIISRMGSGEMPPEEEPQPDAGKTQRIIEWITAKIRDGESARMARRPTVAHYRLSREEYAHTIYDLLGVTYDPRAPGAFTEDPQWHGFERIGSELSLAPSHVEKYLQAADEIVEQAFPDSTPRETKTRRAAIEIDWNNRQKAKDLEKIGVLDHVRALIWPGHRLSYLRPDGGYRQAAGIYRAKIQLSGLAPEGSRPPHLELYSKELDRMIFEADVIAAENEPAILEFETYLPAGRFGITISNAVPGPSNSGRAGRPGEFVFTTLADPKSRAPWQRKMTDDEGKPLYPFLIFDWIEWEGPIVNPEDAAKREGLFPTNETDSNEIRQCLRRFASRAWRCYVADGEIDRYAKIVDGQLAAGAEPRQAYKAGLIAILASHRFSYLVEGEPAKQRNTINDFELASRLSYFLWSSMPDPQLLKAAGSGMLSEPEVLRAQVARMMTDSKIDRFTDSFPRQWLQLSRVGMFPPDQKLYPDYDQWLEQSMILETKHYFAEMFRENLPLAEFLDSDWTMLNPRLSYHYGLPIPNTADFQRVSLRPEDHRGGILTHGSVLSLTSDGTRHRPVHRGVWVSEAILGKTPPPPPANVDAIEPNPVTEPKATIRMQLAAHMADPNCAGCHAKIDPLGFAFDNYDAIGRWRDVEIVQEGTGKNPLVDASGKLPNGLDFDGPVAFKSLLARETDEFARSFVEKLANYALRRAMTVDDQPQISEIVARAKTNDYRMRDLIEGFVTSNLFLKR